MKDNIISSGSTLMDQVLGGGYIPGTIINIIADSGTGKSFLAAEIIANAHNVYGDKLKWKYADIENGFQFDTQELYGIQITDSTKYTPLTVEEMAGDLAIELDRLKEDEFFIYVIDSYDALSSTAEKERDGERTKAYIKEKEFKGSTYAMEKAKFSSEFFRLRTQEIENKNCLLVIISQIRDNVGVTYGRKWTRAGGKALDFYASSIITLSRTEDFTKTVKGEERSYGYGLKVKSLKSRNPNPYRSCFVNVLYSYGLDDISSNIDYLYQFKTDGGKSRAITKQSIPKSDWIEEEGTWKKDEFINFIEENNLQKELTRRVKERWDFIDEAVKPQRKKKFS
jgi:RecA/RadA recombinase